MLEIASRAALPTTLAAREEMGSFLVARFPSALRESSSKKLRASSSARRASSESFPALLLVGRRAFSSSLSSQLSYSSTRIFNYRGTRGGFLPSLLSQINDYGVHCLLSLFLPLSQIRYQRLVQFSTDSSTSVLVPKVC